MGSIIGSDTIRDGLVLYLDAGNNKSSSSGTNWYDLSNFKNNGIITGATFDSSIKGGTFIFDVNDKINCGNDSSIQLTTSFSISVFLKISNTGQNNYHIVGRDDIITERSFSYGCKNSGEHRLDYWFLKILRM